MITKTITINLYTFAELSENAKKKAIQNLSTINVFHGWYDEISNELGSLGIGLGDFDFDSRSIDIEYKQNRPKLAQGIVDETEEGTRLHDLAANYLERLDNITEQFESDLKDAILQKLEDEIGRRLSKEAVIESIEESEIYFTEDGKPETRDLE